MRHRAASGRSSDRAGLGWAVHHKMALAMCNNAMNFTENQHGNAMMERLKGQRESGRLCDVVLHVHGKQMAAHRNVLAACSPYFDSILKVRKASKEQLTITCHDHQAFQCLLNYMYTGHVVIDKNNVAELLRLSNHFLVSKLKTYCAEYLDRYLEVGNCLSVKEMAEKYHMPSLVKNATRFIEGHVHEVMLHPEVLALPLPKIECFLSDKSWNIPQDALLQFITRWVKHGLGGRERDLRALLTFVNWAVIDKNFVAAHIDSENIFFTNNQRCFYFILQCLEENNVHLAKYGDSYSELKSKFSPAVDNLDSDSFLNMAISTAIEGLQDANVPPKDESVDDPSFNPVTVTALSKRHRTRDVSTTASAPPPPSLPPVTAPSHLPPTADQNQMVQRVAPQDNTEDTKATVVLVNGTSKSSPGLLQKKKLGSGIKVIRHQRKRRRLKRLPRLLSSRHGAIRLTRRCRRKVVRVRRKLDRYEAEDDYLDDEDDEDDDEDDEDEDDEDNDDSDETFDVDGAGRWDRRERIKCPQCGYVARGTLRLERHVARAHSRQVTYKCGMCSFTCRWNRDYYSHMRSHFEGPPFKCDTCEYTCDRIQLILTHRVIHADAAVAAAALAASQPQFQCEECNFRTRTKAALAAHTRSHASHAHERPYRCELCGRSFASQLGLEHHLRAAHGPNAIAAATATASVTPNTSPDHVFVCETCGFVTQYQSHLIAHRRLHGVVSSSPSAVEVYAHLGHQAAAAASLVPPPGPAPMPTLSGHIAPVSHTIAVGADVFRCQFPNCGYASPKKSQLSQHMRTHTAVRSHVCGVCGRAFVEKSHLVRHERIHLNEKPFKCDKCDYCSSRRDKLKEHVQKHHGGAVGNVHVGGHGDVTGNQGHGPRGAHIAQPHKSPAYRPRKQRKQPYDPVPPPPPPPAPPTAAAAYYAAAVSGVSVVPPIPGSRVGGAGAGGAHPHGHPHSHPHTHPHHHHHHHQNHHHHPNHQSGSGAGGGSHLGGAQQGQQNQQGTPMTQAGSSGVTDSYSYELAQAHHTAHQNQQMDVDSKVLLPPELSVRTFPLDHHQGPPPPPNSSQGQNTQQSQNAPPHSSPAPMPAAPPPPMPPLPRSQPPPTMVFDPRYHTAAPSFTHLPPGLDQRTQQAMHNMNAAAAAAAAQGGGNLGHTSDYSGLSAFMALF